MNKFVIVCLLITPSLAQQPELERVTQPFVPPAVELATLPGDFDGDGDVDVLRVESDRIQLLRNDGEGVFAAAAGDRMPLPPSVPLGFFSVSAMAAGDIDNDGDLDVACVFFGFAGPVPGTMLVNNGQGQFTDQSAARWPASADRVTGLVFLDADADGDLDLAASCTGAGFDPPSDGTNLLLWNGGAGVFTYDALQGPGGRWHAIASADFDRDGRTDLLLGGEQGFQISQIALLRAYRNLGGGALQLIDVPLGPGSFHSLVLLDHDADGDQDVVAGTSTPVLLNNANGTLVQSGSLPPGTRVHSGDAGDLDGDGDQDLLLRVFLSSGQLAERPQLWQNQGLGLFVDASVGRIDHLRNIRRPWLRDFDGDGDVDLFSGEVSFQTGAGILAPALEPDLPEETRNPSAAIPAAADLDGDRVADAVRWVAASPTPTIDIFRSNGRGRMNLAASLPAGVLPARALVLHDLDADLDRDLLLLTTGAPRLWRNDGNMTFADVTSQRLPADPATNEALVVGDVDRDDDVDLLLARNGQDVLWRQQANGVFADDTALSLPAESSATGAVRLVDVDGDGDLDAIAGDASAAGTAVRLLRNDGAGRFTDRSAGRVPVLPPVQAPGVRALATGDIDLDGDIDLVVGTSSYSAIWHNDGSGRFTAVLSAPAGFDELCDIDDDGDLDLVYPAADFVYRNVFGVLQRQPFASVGTTSVRRALADVDRDGDLDEVSSAGIRKNLVRQLLDTLPPRIGMRAEFTITARPGTAVLPQIVLVGIAEAPALPPIPVPSVGDFGLDWQTVRLFAIHAFAPPGGRVIVPYRVPNAAGLLGQSAWLQSLSDDLGAPSALRLGPVLQLEIRM